MLLMSRGNAERRCGKFFRRKVLVGLLDRGVVEGLLSGRRCTEAEFFSRGKWSC